MTAGCEYFEETCNPPWRTIGPQTRFLKQLLRKNSAPLRLRVKKMCPFCLRLNPMLSACL